MKRQSDILNNIGCTAFTHRVKRNYPSGASVDEPIWDGTDEEVTTFAMRFVKDAKSVEVWRVQSRDANGYYNLIKIKEIKK